jgi:hypothetical protein
MLIGLQSVMEEVQTIRAELNNKGLTQIGFSTLIGFIEDRIKECN